MSSDNTQISKLQDILLSFISEQKKFNTEQRKFNERIDKKIDKVQYYLEESLAQTTKMFFEEQMELKAEVKELESEISRMGMIITTLMSEMKQLQLKVN